MATLLDTISRNLRSTGLTGSPGMQDNTGQVQALARAKGGKAVPGSTSSPRLSNVQEQVQTFQNTQALEQERQAANLQAEQLSQQEAHQKQEQEQANEVIDAERLQVQESYARQAESILRDLSRNEEELSFRRDGARLEQAGFLLRLQNDQYLEQLNNEAARAQLDSELSFREELTRTIFEEEEELFRSNLAFRSLLNADARSFSEEIASINLDFALDLAEAEARQANEQMMWTGAGNILSGAIGAWDKFGGQTAPQIENTTELSASKNPTSILTTA